MDSGILDTGKTESEEEKLINTINQQIEEEKEKGVAAQDQKSYRYIHKKNTSARLAQIGDEILTKGIIERDSQAIPTNTNQLVDTYVESNDDDLSNRSMASSSNDLECEVVEPSAKRRRSGHKSQAVPLENQLLQVLIDRYSERKDTPTTSPAAQSRPQELMPSVETDDLITVHKKIEALYEAGQLDESSTLAAISLAEDQNYRRKMLTLPNSLLRLWINSQILSTPK